MKPRVQDHDGQEPKRNHRVMAYGAIYGPIYRQQNCLGDRGATWYAAVGPDLVRKTKGTKRSTTK